jgi:hypothetical protein
METSPIGYIAGGRWVVAGAALLARVRRRAADLWDELVLPRAVQAQVVTAFCSLGEGPCWRKD